jgi:hypothetical protein
MDYLNHVIEHEPEMAAKLKTIAKMMVNGANKGDLMRIIYSPEEYNKVDSAYPQPYADQIREIYPNFRKGNYCFSYVENQFGELVNLNDNFVEWIFTTKQN